MPSGEYSVAGEWEMIAYRSDVQFRMHSSSNVEVHIDTPGVPIIEDCSAIQFAPLASDQLVAQDFNAPAAGLQMNWQIIQGEKSTSRQDLLANIPSDIDKTKLLTLLNCILPADSD